MQLVQQSVCRRFAMMNNLEAYIVLNETDIDPTLRRVMNEIDKKPELESNLLHQMMLGI